MNVAAIPQQEEGSSRRRRMEAALAEDIEEQQEEGIVVKGRWATVLKWHLVLVPIFVAATLAWGRWVTVSTIEAQSFRAVGARVTPLDLHEAIAKLPTKTKLEKLETAVRTIETNQTRILTILERLEKR